MVDLDKLEPGTRRSYERTFTREDVEAFAELSRDGGYHHLVAGNDGSVLVHGLLTATWSSAGRPTVSCRRPGSSSPTRPGVI